MINDFSYIFLLSFFIVIFNAQNKYCRTRRNVGIRVKVWFGLGCTFQFSNLFPVWGRRKNHFYSVKYFFSFCNGYTIYRLPKHWNNHIQLTKTINQNVIRFYHGERETTQHTHIQDKHYASITFWFIYFHSRKQLIFVPYNCKRFRD